jgi:hypothetical protein
MKALKVQRLVILQAMLLSISLASCGQPSAAPPEMEDLAMLEKSLEHSGLEIQRGGRTSPDLFGFEGQILLFGGGEIEVYEYESKRQREIVSNQVSAEGIVVDDVTIPWEKKPAIWGSGALIIIYRGYDGGIFLLLSGLMGDPLTYEAPVKDEPYPHSVVVAIRYLADDLQVDPALIQVMDYTEVEWPDTCLGAPRPEEQCSQVLTPGWRVMVKGSGNVYELRTDLMGEQVRKPSW